MTTSIRCGAPVLVAATAAATLGIGIATAAPAAARPRYHSTITAPATSANPAATAPGTGPMTPKPDRVYNRVVQRFFAPPASSIATGASGLSSVAPR